MWLKIETGLPTKLEVFRISEMLEISRAEVVGHLVSLWAWFDFNSIDGVIPNIGSNGIIDAHTRQGFADAMHAVGWLKYNEDFEQEGITKLILPNFERHNGQTAKKRATSQQRQQRFRNAKALQEASPEKRREDKKEIKDKRENTPFEEVVILWNKSNTPRVERLTNKRKAAIRQLCKDYTLEQIGGVFDQVPKIEWMNGKNDRGWRANFDYVTRADAFLKIFEGSYEASQGTASTDFDEWNK